MNGNRTRSRISKGCILASLAWVWHHRKSVSTHSILLYLSSRSRRRSCLSTKENEWLSWCWVRSVLFRCFTIKRSIWLRFRKIVRLSRTSIIWGDNSRRWLGDSSSNKITTKSECLNKFIINRETWKLNKGGKYFYTRNSSALIAFTIGKATNLNKLVVY